MFPKGKFLYSIRFCCRETERSRIKWAAARDKRSCCPFDLYLHLRERYNVGIEAEASMILPNIEIVLFQVKITKQR